MPQDQPAALGQPMKVRADADANNRQSVSCGAQSVLKLRGKQD